jgi:Cof subfamily protein (haloacid dehalogenase superfamily)
MKLIFLDADGTLFQSDGHIPASAKEEIVKLQKQGHKIILCTGRQKAEVYGPLLKIDYDGMITGAGAAVFVKDDLLFEEDFTAEEQARLMEYTQANRLPAIWESANELYGSEEAIALIEKLWQAQCAHLSPAQLELHGLHKIRSLLRTLPKQFRANKISLVDSPSLKEVAKDLPEFDVIPSTFDAFGPEAGEIALPRLTKATGMDVIAKHFNLPLSESIAVGDGWNDLPMFEKAGVSVAMGNGPAEVKEKADVVAPALDEDGLAWALKTLVNEH